MTRKVPSFIEVYEDATTGIGNDWITYKMKKSLPLRLTERISRHECVYYEGRYDSGNFQLYHATAMNHLEKISCPSAFIKSFAKPHKRSEVTTSDVAEAIKLLVDPENEFSSPLPPRDTKFVCFQNGCFNVTYGKFRKNGDCCCSGIGYQRYAVQCDFAKKGTARAKGEDVVDAVGSPETYQNLLRCLSALLSGYPVQRCLLWCHHPDTADLLQRVLNSLLPQTGAVATLKITDAIPDFQRIARSDSHAVLIHVRDATELTATAWKKLKALAEAQKPTLIISTFQPFMAHDTDPDGFLKDRLYLVPAVTRGAGFANNLLAKPDWLACLASESMKFLYEFINAVEPETAQDIDELLAKPNPNDLAAMISLFLETATIETESESDVIELKDDFCVKLAKFVEKAGGDPKKVSHQGVGAYLKSLGVKRNEIKLPGRRGKVVCLIGRKWK